MFRPLLPFLLALAACDPWAVSSPAATAELQAAPPEPTHQIALCCRCAGTCKQPQE